MNVDKLSTITFIIHLPDTRHVLRPEECCLYVAVPQVLAMMVDLEEEEDWSTQDEMENNDEDRYTT